MPVSSCRTRDVIAASACSSGECGRWPGRGGGPGGGGGGGASASVACRGGPGSEWEREALWSVRVSYAFAMERATASRRFCERPTVLACVLRSTQTKMHKVTVSRTTTVAARKVIRPRRLGACHAVLALRVSVCGSIYLLPSNASTNLLLPNFNRMRCFAIPGRRWMFASHTTPARIAYSDRDEIRA